MTRDSISLTATTSAMSKMSSIAVPIDCEFVVTINPGIA